MAKRATLGGGLQEVLSRKVSGTLSTLPQPEAEAVAAPPAQSAKTDDRVQIIVRMTTAERKALRQIALDLDTTAQALAEEAIRDVLRRHGHTT